MNRGGGLFVLVLCACAGFALADEATPGSAQPSSEQVSLQGYANAAPSCAEWSDGCATCSRDAAGGARCSTPGIACQPGPIACRKESEN